MSSRGAREGGGGGGAWGIEAGSNIPPPQVHLRTMQNPGVTERGTSTSSLLGHGVDEAEALTMALARSMCDQAMGDTALAAGLRRSLGESPFGSSSSSSSSSSPLSVASSTVGSTR